MEEASIGLLSGLLVVLFMMSAFFSGSETALMALNRYRLTTLAEQGHPGALKAQKLLQTPDRLIGLILLGNNFINILITQLATFLGLRIFGDAGIAIATGLLTLVLLIFAEVAPKTLGALHSEKIAFPASYVYSPLLTITYPMVWMINLIANSLLKMIGVPVDHLTDSNALSREELRTVVNEASSTLEDTHHEMLLGILDLEKVHVEDIMVPRSEVVAIDLDDDWNDVEDLLRSAPYTRMPVCRGNLDNILGYLHLRSITSLLVADELTPEALENSLREPYFIPDSTSVTQQLLNFKEHRRRHAVVVDEYGEVQGIVTMEDLLQEIVGEFTRTSVANSEYVHAQKDGSHIVDASLTIREINKLLGTELPVDGPKTLNGLLLEQLENIPTGGTSCLVESYPIEVIKTTDQTVKSARIGRRLST